MPPGSIRANCRCRGPGAAGTRIIGDFLGGVRELIQPGTQMTLTMTNLISAGDQVVAEWTARGTMRTGRAYHNRNIAVFTVHDGKITSVREYTDTQHVEHVLFG